MGIFGSTSQAKKFYKILKRKLPELLEIEKKREKIFVEIEQTYTRYHKDITPSQKRKLQELTRKEDNLLKQIKKSYITEEQSSEFKKAVSEHSIVGQETYTLIDTILLNLAKYFDACEERIRKEKLFLQIPSMRLFQQVQQQLAICMKHSNTLLSLFSQLHTQLHNSQKAKTAGMIAFVSGLFGKVVSAFPDEIPLDQGGDGFSKESETFFYIVAGLAMAYGIVKFTQSTLPQELKESKLIKKFLGEQ